MTDAGKAVRFLAGLRIPEGRLAGRGLKVAPFQKQFVRGALAREVSVACLSIGRGNGKSALAAGLALGDLLGAWDTQPRREVPAEKQDSATDDAAQAEMRARFAAMDDPHNPEAWT